LQEVIVAYPEKILADDERVVEHLHPHWITLVPATLWFLVIAAAASFGLTEIYNNMDSGTGRTVVVAIVLVVAVVLLCWLSFAPWIRWRTTHYVFTTHRVLIRRGVLRRTGRDIALQRISDVGFSQSLWDRIVKAGTVTIESAGEQGQEQLTNIPRSERQQQLLNHLIEQDSSRRAREAQAPYVQQQPGAGGHLPPPATPPLPPGYPTQQYSQPYPPQPGQ
jgi:uncharacterized membrane protein YdbT with pleckstrin-like domain